MRLGVHVSISGNISKVPERAHAPGCQTFQIFSRNPRGWKFDKEIGLKRLRLVSLNDSKGKIRLAS